MNDSNTLQIKLESLRARVSHIRSWLEIDDILVSIVDDGQIFTPKQRVGMKMKMRTLLLEIHRLKLELSDEDTYDGLDKPIDMFNKHMEGGVPSYE